MYPSWLGHIYEMILYMMWGKNEKFDIKRQVNSSFLNIFKTINSSNKTLRIFVRRSAHIKLLWKTIFDNQNRKEKFSNSFYPRCIALLYCIVLLFLFFLYSCTLFASRVVVFILFRITVLDFAFAAIGLYLNWKVKHIPTSPH